MRRRLPDARETSYSKREHLKFMTLQPAKGTFSMTSNLIRNVLVAGACVAALGIVGCSKKAADAASSAESSAAAASDAAAAASSAAADAASSAPASK